MSGEKPPDIVSEENSRAVLSWYLDKFQHTQLLARGTLTIFASLLLPILTLLARYWYVIPTPPSGSDSYRSTANAVPFFEVGTGEAIQIVILNIGIAALGCILALSVGWKALNLIMNVLLYDRVPPNFEFRQQPVVLDEEDLSTIGLENTLSSRYSQWIKESSKAVIETDSMLRSAAYRLLAIGTILFVAGNVYYMAILPSVSQLLLTDFLIVIVSAYLLSGIWTRSIEFEYNPEWQTIGLIAAVCLLSVYSITPILF